MNENCILCIEETKEHMNSTLQFFEKELHKVRVGKANPQMLESIKVDYYGTPTAIDQVANVSTPDARQIVVQPWDKNMLSVIDKAIQAANLGFNPQTNADFLRIMVPPLTEERRKDLVKKAKQEAEQARVNIRNIRRKANEELKGLEKKDVSEDEIKKSEIDIQKITEEFIGKIDKILEVKEKDIMTV
ncbi:MAG: ribosome recycling factor [Bacteroidota bacterium]